MAVAKSLPAILEGIPASNDHRVVNRDLRVKLQEMELQGALSGALFFADDLVNLTGGVEGDTGFVLDDATAANNGVYTKGASEWGKVSELPAGFASFANNLAQIAFSGDSDDLTEGEANLLLSVEEREKLAGIAEGAEANDLGAEMLAAAAKAAPVGGDVVVALDAETGSLIKLSLSSQPISTRTQAALDQKANSTDVDQSLDRKADLDSSGKIPASQIPGGTSALVEVPNYASLPPTGTSEVIYVTVDDGLTFRWGGSVYVEISSSLALGETVETAFRGDRGKLAYEHSLLKEGNPHDLTKDDVGLGEADNTRDDAKPVSGPQQQALDALEAAELVARSGLALQIFETTGFNTIEVEKGPGNGITPSWTSALYGWYRTGIITISSMSSTYIAPGKALVIDLTGSSPYVPTIQTANTALYDQVVAGTKAILIQQSSNRHIGALSLAVTRALDYARTDQIDNTSDDAKPLSADALTAFNALSWKHLDSTGGNGITTAIKNGNGHNLGWPEQKFGSPLGEIVVASRTAAYLAPNKILYVDPAEAPAVDPEQNPNGAFTLVEATSSALLSALHAVGGIVIVVQADEGRVGGLMGAAINRKIDRDRIEAVAASAHLATMQPEGMVADQQWLATPSWNRNLAFKEINVGTSWFQYQPEGRDGCVAITNANTKLDLECMPSGSTVMVWSKGGGSKVVFHAVPLGQTGNRATLSADDVIYVRQLGTRDAPKFLVSVLNGTPSWDTFSRPAMDQSIVLAGQSNWSIAAVSGGIGGFADRLYQRYGTSYPSTYFIEAATGGSSITGTDGHWNGVLPGTAGQTYIDAIDAAVAAGQPIPTETMWRQGEQDITDLNDGTMTTAYYKSQVQAFFDYVRSYNGGIYSAMEFIVSGPQAQDDDTEFGGAMAARTAYIELAEELSYVFPDAGWYDVPRQFGNVHPFNAGYHAMGHRSATAWLRSLHSSEVRDMGPYINMVTLAEDGLSVSLDIRCETDTIIIPNGRRGAGADLGPYPFEFCAINGDPRTAAPIELTGGTIARVSDTQVTVTLTADTDLTGAQIYTYNGKSHNARRGQFLRNNNVHGPSLGYPTRDQRTAVLA